MISKGYAACLASTKVCEHVCASVSCQFSHFHLSELDDEVSVQCVGVLSTGYCLTHDITTKGPTAKLAGRSGKLLYDVCEHTVKSIDQLT